MLPSPSEELLQLPRLPPQKYMVMQTVGKSSSHGSHTMSNPFNEFLSKKKKI